MSRGSSEGLGGCAKLHRVATGRVAARAGSFPGLRFAPLRAKFRVVPWGRLGRGPGGKDEAIDLEQERRGGGTKGATVSFGEWLQRRRIHVLVLTIPICTVTYMVGAVIFQIFPFTRSALWSRRFLLETIFFGVCMGVFAAFLIRPPHWLKKE